MTAEDTGLMAFGGILMVIAIGATIIFTIFRKIGNDVASDVRNYEKNYAEAVEKICAKHDLEEALNNELESIIEVSDARVAADPIDPIAILRDPLSSLTIDIFEAAPGYRRIGDGLGFFRTTDPEIISRLTPGHYKKALVADEIIHTVENTRRAYAPLAFIGMEYHESMYYVIQTNSRINRATLVITGLRVAYPEKTLALYNSLVEMDSAAREVFATTYCRDEYTSYYHNTPSCHEIYVPCSGQDEMAFVRQLIRSDMVDLLVNDHDHHLFAKEQAAIRKATEEAVFKATAQKRAAMRKRRNAISVNKKIFQ